MALFALFSAIGSALSEQIRESARNGKWSKIVRDQDDMDWENIEHVALVRAETTYRIETREEFDPVMTDMLSQMDGWAHYETETVEHRINNGENYVFSIKCKNGNEIFCKSHESSSLTARLLEYCDALDESCEDSDCAVESLESSSTDDVFGRARSYLERFDYSRDGLIEELIADGFTEAQAECAADTCGGDWMNNAGKRALACKNLGYSRISIVGQLEYEGFTAAQAEFGADAVDNK